MTIRIISSSIGTARVDVRDFSEHIQRWWLKGSFYEPKMLEWIRLNYSGGTFVDVGSSIGNHALFFALFCDAKVLSVEPWFNSVKHQMRNIKLNNLRDRVILEHCALSNKPGRCSMINISPEDNYSIGMFQVMPGDEVEVRTLDSLIEQHQIDDVTLVKIDVEWYEHYVLEGSVRLLESQHPVLFVEAPNMPHLVRIKEFLEPFGYRYARRHSATPTHEFVWRG